MADRYTPDFVPQEYDSAFLLNEHRRISQALEELEVTTIRLVPQGVEPLRPREGDVAFANGTNWNPGAGAGAYERRAGAWVKL